MQLGSVPCQIVRRGGIDVLRFLGQHISLGSRNGCGSPGRFLLGQHGVCWVPGQEHISGAGAGGAVQGDKLLQDLGW